MLPSFEEYCRLIASLPDRYASIQSSTLTAYTIGPMSAEIKGKVIFKAGYALDIWELIDLANATICSYSYELDHNGERVWWYDPIEHPRDTSLQISYPHHKHIQPDIKHHRIPSPELSFTRPNIPILIESIEQLLKSK